MVSSLKNWPVVLDVLAREQPIEELDRLEHPVDPLGRLGPVVGDDVLVERLAAAEAEPEAARVHRGQRGRGLGDDERVDAEGRARHAGPDVALVRSPSAVMNVHTNAAWPCCGTHGWRWSAAITPLKPACSASDAVVEELRRVELLEHRRVADLLALPFSSGSRATIVPWWVLRMKRDAILGPEACDLALAASSGVS